MHRCSRFYSLLQIINVDVSFSLKGSTVSAFSFPLGKHWRETGVKELGMPAVLYGSPQFLAL